MLSPQHYIKKWGIYKNMPKKIPQENILKYEEITTELNNNPHRKLTHLLQEKGLSASSFYNIKKNEKS